jgi:chromate transporter
MNTPKTQTKARRIAELAAIFAKMSCITFGGGYAMLPIVERELVRKRHWTTTDEILECYTIAQVTPGVIAVNMATMIGYRRAGLLGGIVATLAFVLPPLTAIVVIALCLRNFAEMPVVKHCFAGVRLAVGALVLDTALRLVTKLPKKGLPLLKNALLLAVFAASFVLSTVFSANPVVLVVGAGMVGFLFLADSVKGGEK